MKKGFTLLELIIVVIILGILVSIAIPQFTGTRLRAYSAEALNVLGALRSSEIRYYEQWGGYATSSSLLDVTPTALRYHGTLTYGTSAANLASMVLNSTLGNYTLQISNAGTIACSSTGDACTRLGYPAP